MRNKKTLIILTFLCFSIFSILAAETKLGATDAAIQYLNNNKEETAGVSLVQESDDLLLSDVPISYGEEQFKARIKAITGDDRSAIGLVLSGGSARAFAHIGVLEYLEEIGFVPDFIISNSMGSIIALLYGAGMSPQQIAYILNNVSIGSLFDLTLPINNGILVADKMKNFLNSFIPEGTRIENLSIPVMVVEEDLITKRQIHVMEGNLSDVLIASFALPAYFGSGEYHGHLIIDGGIANLVPLDLAYQYASLNIVSTTFYDNKSINLKNPLTALNTSIDIGKRRQGVKDILKHKDTSIWIRCNVESISFMEFSALNELIAEGYKNAKNTFEAADVKKLEEIPHGSLTDSLIEKRKEFDSIIATQEKKYSYYHHIKIEDNSTTVGLKLETFGYNNDSYYLRDDILYGLSVNSSYKDWDGNLLLGYSFSKDVEGSPFKPTLHFNTNYYAFSALHLSFDLSLLFPGPTDFETASYYLNQSIEYKIILMKSFNFTFKETFEAISNPSTSTSEVGNSSLQWTGKGSLLTTEFDFFLKNKSSDINGIVGFNLLDWEDNDNKVRFFPFVKINNNSPLGNSDFNIDNNLFIRIAVDGEGNVPFFYSEDQFRSYHTSLRSQGSPTNDENKQNFLTGFSTVLNWKPTFLKNLTFGELLLISDNQIGGFFDLLWFDDSTLPIIPSLSVGLKLSSTVSLIGLKTLPFSFYIGWDQLSSDMFYSLRVGKQI